MHPTVTVDGAGDVLRLRVAAGLTAEDDPALSSRTRRTVAVAREVGAPIAEALDAAWEAEEDGRRAERAVTVASAQVRVVAGGLLVAPLVLVPVLGRLLGADLAGFYGSAVGIAVLTVGIALLAVGAALIVLLVRRVRQPDRSSRCHPPGAAPLLAVGIVATWWLAGPVVAVLVLAVVVARHARTSQRPLVGDPVELEEAVELIATALRGGVSATEAVRAAARQLPALAPQLHRLAFDLAVGTRGSPGDADRGRGGAARRTGGGPGAPADGNALERLAVVLTAAHDLGAPVAPTLRRFAAQLRADQLARALAAAERLPAQLTFPTALCLLPGTLLLIGAPIVQAGLAAAGT